MDGQKPENEQSPSPMQFAPGDTVRPQQQMTQPSGAEQSVETQPAAEQPATKPEAPVTQNASEPESGEGPAEQVQATQAAPQPPSAFHDTAAYTTDNAVDQTQTGAFNWTASEFIAHHKTSGWYVLLLLAACTAAVLVWWVTKDVVSSVVIVLVGVVFASYAARKPRQLSYQLDLSGLTIGQRHYSYNEFRSFSVVPEGAFSSVVFMPLKRFGAPITIYYDPKDEQQVVDAIITRLPYEEHKADPVDRMLHRIRF